MILASIFESLLKPFIIMFTVPLAAIGSLWAIIFTGNSIANVNVLIGLLILLGIVVNNGIILIDYIRQLQQQGMRRIRAIIVAGQARLRFFEAAQVVSLCELKARSQLQQEI